MKMVHRENGLHIWVFVWCDVLKEIFVNLKFTRKQNAARQHELFEFEFI